MFKRFNVIRILNLQSYILALLYKLVLQKSLYMLQTLASLVKALNGYEKGRKEIWRIGTPKSKCSMQMLEHTIPKLLKELKCKDINIESIWLKTFQYMYI